MFGHIKSIEIVVDYRIEPVANINGSGGRLGMTQMLNVLSGFSNMDGYKVVTSDHTFHVLIDNGQSCCESWGYFSSEDDLSQYVGSVLFEINLTDKALNQLAFEQSGYFEDSGGIQFVDFVTSRGTFQIAVYNAHNGYYGHGILVAKDSDILVNDTL